MKRITQIIPVILLMIIPVNSFSQTTLNQKSGLKPALLVIDIQNAYLEGMPQREKEVAMLNINYYIQLFRSYGYPVIRIYHYDKQYGPEQGTEAFEFPASVLTKTDDPRIVKTFPDAFTKTELDNVLKTHGSNTLFMCGLSSFACVLATWFGAQNNNYNAFIIKDATMSFNPDYTNNVEIMFDAVGPDVIRLMLSNSR